MLDIEFKYFKDHQKDLVSKYPGRYVAIKGEEVIGDYASELDAYTEAKKTHEVGTFLIQRCIPGDDAYTQTFHSRVYLVNP
jgi:hypothetical protein